MVRMNNCMGTMPKVHFRLDLVMAYYRDGYGLWQRLRNLDGIISHLNSLHKVSLSTDDKELTKQNFKMFLRIVNGGSARSVKLYIHTSWPVNLFTFKLRSLTSNSFDVLTQINFSQLNLLNQNNNELYYCFLLKFLINVTKMSFIDFNMYVVLFYIGHSASYRLL